jgi:hypothetical protein
VAAAIVALVAPGAAHAASGCPAQPVSRPFLPWLDLASYEAVPDGGFEAAGTGWSLDGAAAVVAGNESYAVGSPADRSSLALGPDAAATTAPICLGVEHPSLRFFARNTGAPLSTLAVSVVFTDVLGQPRSLPIGRIRAGSEWAPGPVLPVIVNLESLLGDQSVAFRFAPADALGAWRIDDVYVDPYSKG